MAMHRPRPAGKLTEQAQAHKVHCVDGMPDGRRAKRASSRREPCLRAICCTFVMTLYSKLLQFRMQMFHNVMSAQPSRSSPVGMYSPGYQQKQMQTKIAHAAGTASSSFSRSTP